MHDCWSDFAENLPEPSPEAADQAPQMDPQDQDTIQQAIVRVGMVIRSAQDRSEPDFNMDELLDQVEADGIAQLDADPRVLQIASSEASADEVRTLARAMSLYKEAMDGESAHRPRDGNGDVSQQVAYRQLAGIVDLALSGLSPDLRGTFDLACLQEESYRDVAEIQCIPIGTVRSRVNRVRTLLRSRLKHGFADYAS